MRYFLSIIFIVLFYNQAFAQDSIFDADSNGIPVQVDSSNGLEWIRNKKIYIARGDVLVKRGDALLKADVVTLRYRGGEKGKPQQIYEMNAKGNVTMVSKGTQAHGDEAVYDLDEKVAVLVGKNLSLISSSGTITAKDSLEYWDARNIAVARGNATVIKGDKRLKADTLVAYLTKNPKTQKQEIQNVNAIGHVVATTKTQTVSGEKGRYNAKTGRIIICGNVTITNGKNQLNGNCAQTNLNTGISRIISGNGERVKGLVFPQSQK